MSHTKHLRRKFVRRIIEICLGKVFTAYQVYSSSQRLDFNFRIRKSKKDNYTPSTQSTHSTSHAYRPFFGGCALNASYLFMFGKGCKVSPVVNFSGYVELYFLVLIYILRNQRIKILKLSEIEAMKMQPPFYQIVFDI